MLLQRLVDYSDRLALPPPLYSERVVRYVIDLDADGHLRNPQPIDTADSSDRRTRRGQSFLVPSVQRATRIKPLLLSDNAEYTFGLARETSRPERVEDCHAAYLELLERCIAVTGDARARVVLVFLQNDPLAHLEIPTGFDRGEAIAFRVAGHFATDTPAVQRFWAAEHRPRADDEGVHVMQCLLCGEEKPILERLLGKIKGVPGGQTSGTAIISANAPAFESYGLKASLIAPTCADCGERFTKALNALITDPSSRLYLAGSVFVFWTRDPDSTFFVSSLLESASADDVKQLLGSVYSSRYDPGLDPDSFYALSLSASGGRTVVRDWIDTTVGEVKRHMAGWFSGQRIVGYDGDEGAPLGIHALSAGIVRDLQKDLPPPTARALLRAALTGTPVPWVLLNQAIRRNRAEQAVNRQRAALIKLILISHRLIEEETMVQLDRNFDDPGYLCGRLLAVLERAQTAAIPGIKATIVDRFYGTASSAPQTVFPRLIRGAQAHFSKLRRDKPGWEHALQEQCEEILGKLPPLDRNPDRAGIARGAYGVPVNFPAVLTPQQQGLFALGYYHQRAWSRAQAREIAAARREAGSAGSQREDDLQAGY